jgi:hypothetical protein
MTLRVWADSTTYIEYARSSSTEPLITAVGNFLGPVYLYRITGFRDWAVALINGLLLISSLTALARLYRPRVDLFVFLVVMNPMALTAVITLNKEIFGLASVAFFAVFTSTQRVRYLLPALLLAVATRWQHALVVAVFLSFMLPWYPLRHRRWWSLILTVGAISLIYPVLLGDFVRASFAWDTVLLDQVERGGGILPLLNRLQDNYLFFVAVVPKVLFNLVGNLGRAVTLFTRGPADPADIYNSYVVLGHQVATAIVLMVLVLRRRITLSSDPMYFAAFYCIVFAISPFVQYRYYFPIYILLALDASRSLSETRVQAPLRISGMDRRASHRGDAAEAV